MSETSGREGAPAAYPSVSNRQNVGFSKEPHAVKSCIPSIAFVFPAALGPTSTVVPARLSNSKTRSSESLQSYRVYMKTHGRISYAMRTGMTRYRNLSSPAALKMPGFKGRLRFKEHLRRRNRHQPVKNVLMVERGPGCFRRPPRKAEFLPPTRHPVTLC